MHASSVFRAVRRKPSIGRILIDNLLGRALFNLHRNPGHGWTRRPEQLTIVVTDICNLRCKMCHYAYSDSPGYTLNRMGHMKPEVFRKIMAEAPGRPFVSFTGGETLLHPNICELIAHAKTYKRFCSLTTNGWMLRKKAHELCEAGLDLLVVSMDGPRSIHNSIRGKNSYERLIEGVETILRIEDRPFVFISMAISNMNYTNLVDSYELAKDLGVDGLNFNHLWIQSPKMTQAHNAKFSPQYHADVVSWEVDQRAVEPDIVYDALQEIHKRNRSRSIVVNETPPLNRDEIRAWYRKPERYVKYDRVRCAWIRMRIWPDGTVKTCRDWEAGDAANQDLMTVWRSKPFQAFRDVLFQNKLLPICARCCQLAHP